MTLYFNFYRDFVSDFDLMLEKKKEEMRNQRRKRKDIDIINDNDDLIDALIGRMKIAAEVSFSKGITNYSINSDDFR